MKKLSRFGRQAQPACLSPFEIRELEKDFLAAPDREKTAELAALWARAARQDGCFAFPTDRAWALERAGWFAAWEPGKGTEWLAAFHAGEGAVTVHTAETFVIDRSVFEELFKQAVARQKKGPFGRSVFRIRMSFEIERVTCATCACFTEFCGEIECSSRVDEELAERRELLRRGEALLRGMNRDPGAGAPRR